MDGLTYSLRMLSRDWRAGELGILALAVILAVGSLTAVGFFTDRVQQALQRQANEMIAADVVIIADHAVKKDYIDHAHTLGLRTAQTLEFFSMAQARDRTLLVAIKAVSDHYPLRGELRVAQQRFAEDQAVSAIPALGTVWVDERLLAEMNLELGARLVLGQADYQIAAIITHEPDRGGSWFSVSPRVMLNAHDLPATGLLQPGSRLSYRLLVAGDAAVIKDYQAYVARNLAKGERLESVGEARPEIRTALERARQFLGLANLTTLLLAGLAITTATRRFVQRHLDNCALMRCFGASQAQITRLFLFEMMWLGILAGVVGCVTGYGVHGLLTDALQDLVTADLPAPSWWPALLGLVFGALTLLSFALPPLLHLRQVPPLRVLRKDLGQMPPPGLIVYALGVGLLVVLMLINAGDLKLGVYALLGVALVLSALVVMASILMAILRKSQHRSSWLWRWGLAGLLRRKQSSLIQLTAFGLGLMILLLLGLVRADLFADWQASLPEDTPNRFIINIQPDQVEPLRQYFATQGYHPILYPMIRGRLIAINNNPVAPDQYLDDHARRLISREFNLSYMQDMPEDNQIVAGAWWSAATYDQSQFSVEVGLAETLGIALGDVLTYDIAGQTLTARVTSLRKVEWGSFRANFFVISPPALLQRMPATYMTSLHIAAPQRQVIQNVVRAFPNLTVIDTSVIMQQVKRMMDRVSLAMQYVFIFTLLAGVVVLYAALQSTLDERLQESAILRTLGATRRQLLWGLLMEFAVLGMMAGVIAATGAGVVGYVLAERVFDFDYHWNALLWWVGLAGGLGGALLPGLIAMVTIVRRPPWQTLRERLMS